MTKVRTRFAPSPTGFMHVGGVRTALFAFLTARHSDGEFVLRIEDTDQKREVEGSDEHIKKTLQVLGIKYDEGPDIGGPFAPYYQSQRLDSYKKWAKVLIDKGRAYADPYTPEEIQAFRDQAATAKKPFLYRNHRPENPPVWDGTTPLRLKSEPRDYKWQDAVMGDLHAGAESVDDLILIKSDGFPTYNFAHIIDDMEMEITHIIRGQEFLSSMPNYLNIYEALEIEHPIFATVPHILNETGNKKLGKRDGAKDVLDYIKDGILPEAMLNFIASMGWNDGTEQEIFSVDELIAKFSLDRVQKSGARFDEKRLIWMNGQWIKRLDLEDLYQRTIEERSEPNRSQQSIAVTTRTSEETRNDGLDERTVVSDSASGNFWGKNGAKASEDEQKKVLAVVQERLKTLADLPALTEYFFAIPTPNWAMVESNKQLAKFTHAEQTALLTAARTELMKISPTDWNEEILQSKLNELLSLTNQKPAILFGIIRYALTWAPFSPGLPETMELLGQEETLARLKTAVESA
jgi:glutamyl-tRNA synthetase